MKEHINKVKNHEFGEVLFNSLEIVQEIIDEEQEFDKEGMKVILRSFHVLTHLITIYKNTDPLMVNPRKLTIYVEKNTNPRYNQLPTHLKNYKNNKDINELNKVNHLLNTTITFFSYFIYPKTGREMAGLRGATEKYHAL